MNKNFRVAKCLTEKGIKEFAIFENGTRIPIEKTESGKKYFQIQNPYVSEDASYMEKHFYNRIKDAIQTIYDGYADAIKGKNQYEGGFIHVIRFVDDKISNEYRKKSLEGWKNTKFAYALKAGNKNSFSGYRMIARNGEVLSFLSNQLKFATFETEKEAEVFAESLLKTAQDYVEKILSYKDNGENSINIILEEIHENVGRFTLLEDFIFDLLNESCTDFKREDHNLTEYGYKVCQCVVPDIENVIENEWKAQASILFAGIKNTYKQYSNWEFEDIENLIIGVFKDFYEKNKNNIQTKKSKTEYISDTEIPMTEEVREHLFEKWMKCISENKDLFV